MLISDKQVRSNREQAMYERRMQPRAKNAIVYAGNLSITFLSGSKLVIPLQNIKVLASCSSSQQLSVTVTPDGKTIKWPLANIEMSLRSILDTYLILGEEEKSAAV